MVNQYLPGVNTIPNSLLISNITKSFPMVMTVVLFNYAPNPRVNTYIAGMAVKLYVPRTYGMYQANGLIGKILQISGNNLLLNIDSSHFDTFVIPISPTAESSASISPYGSINLEYNNSTNLVPFQSLNNIGN